MAEVANINVTPDITEDPEYVSQFYVAFQYTTQDTKVPGTGCCYTRAKYTVPTYQDITDIAASIKRDTGYTSVIIISLIPVAPADPLQHETEVAEAEVVE